eukprot:2255284-Pleurochrysis_carterae.AAC.1
MRTRRINKGADVERRTEPRTAQRYACAQGACKKVPTSSGGRSHVPLDAVHAHRRMHKGADVERRAEPRTARRCACAATCVCTKVPTSSGG